MKLQYFGTGAGMGIPEIFCSCRICENARALRGKEIRTRSQAVLDDTLGIDYSVDTFLHTLYGGLDMRKIRHILITHGHHDHFLTADILSRPLWEGEPVRFYASEKSGIGLAKNIENTERAYAEGRRIRTSDFKAEIHSLQPFEPIEINGYEITPLPANHAPAIDPLLFIIRKGNKSLLWCHDTGLLKEETKEYLKKAALQFDFVSLDCTLKRGFPITNHHMDLDRCIETADFLRKHQLLKSHSTIALSHIGHLVEQTHEELEAEASPYGMTVAYDGRIFEI